MNDNKNQYVVLQQVWEQSSADYDSQRKMRSRIVSADTTVGEVMEWAKIQALSVGDVTITKPDQPL